MPTAYVIHGASNRTKRDFQATVATLERRLGREWNLVPVWFGSAGVNLKRVEAGLPHVLPPRPGPFDAARKDNLWGPTIGEAEASGSLEDISPSAVFPGGSIAAWTAKRWVLTNVHRVAADVFMYWHRREEIEQIVLEQIPSTPKEPVNVIAHSLGAIITVDLLLSRRISISGLVTFGTPVAAVHVLDPTRNTAPPFVPGRPVVVRRTARWTNLWNHYDPIGFTAGGVFRARLGSVVDREAKIPDGVKTGDAHGAYWATHELVTAIRDTCG